MTKTIADKVNWLKPLGSIVAQMVKDLPAMWETCILSLDWEDSLEEGTATHSSILPWRILMDRRAWWATVHGGHKESEKTERLSTAQQLRFVFSDSKAYLTIL